MDTRYFTLESTGRGGAAASLSWIPAVSNRAPESLRMEAASLRTAAISRKGPYPLCIKTTKTRYKLPSIVDVATMRLRAAIEPEPKANMEILRMITVHTKSATSAAMTYFHRTARNG